MKGDAGKKADDVKGKRADLTKAQKDLEPLQRQLEELRKASRGQVGLLPASLVLTDLLPGPLLLTASSPWQVPHPLQPGVCIAVPLVSFKVPLGRGFGPWPVRIGSMMLR